MKVQHDFQTFASKTKTRDANLNFLYQTCLAMIRVSYFLRCYFLNGDIHENFVDLYLLSVRGMHWNIASYYRLVQFLSKARVHAFLCTLQFIYDYIICDGDNVL